MKLRDLLKIGEPVSEIEVRTNGPFPEDSEKNDLLFGFCSWDGFELNSLDGDNYYLDEEVYKYEWTEDGLTYWFTSKWSEPERYSQDS